MTRTRRTTGLDLIKLGVGICLAATVAGLITRHAHADEQPPAPAVCVDQAGTMVNECAHLDTTQVIDLRTPAPDVSALPPCLAEDGSTDGQTFPCGWDASEQGNGEGSDFILYGPA